MSREAKRYFKRMHRLGLVREVDGDVMMHGALLLFMAADATSGADKEDARGRQRGKAAMDAVLEGVKAAGYERTAELRKRLENGMRGANTAELAIAAVEAIGPSEKLFEVLGRAGLPPADFMHAARGRLQ